MDIETATIDELYHEISSRCEGCVLVIQKPLKNPDEDNGITLAFAIRYENFVMSLGLIEQAKFYFEKHYLDTYENIEPSEAGLEE